MSQLDARGIYVARILLDAHAAGADVDQAVAVVTTAATTTAPVAARAAPAPAPPCAHPPLLPAPRRRRPGTSRPRARVAPVTRGAPRRRVVYPHPPLRLRGRPPPPRPLLRR
ncbi:hypothetical protein ACGFY6_32215 [Streptomyces sp. NPDC048387]|uniref:hypothetical protein n=1 Tax=Streptomyces sp. NPDC048387 TaxID=3365542 RepID=UPI0037111CB0